jgi:hypothetical protein
MSIFNEATFIPSLSCGLSYTAHVEFIRFLISDVIDSDDEEDIKDYIRFSEYLISILKEADKPANIGVLGTPFGTINCEGMTVRQVFDFLAEHLDTNAISKFGNSIYFNGIIEYPMPDGRVVLEADCENPNDSDSEDD